MFSLLEAQTRTMDIDEFAAESVGPQVTVREVRTFLAKQRVLDGNLHAAG